MAMVNIYEEFHTRDDASGYHERVMREFPPMGYGTVLSIRKSPDNQTFVVSGHRFSSCD